jgi:hypothetical protein
MSTDRKSPEEKGLAIVEALCASDTGHLSKREIMDKAGLTYGQFRDGWDFLRRKLGRIAIVENHREATTYFLGSGVSREAEEYRFHQDQHVFTRLHSLLATLRQMKALAERTDVMDGLHLQNAVNAVNVAAGAMRLEIQHAGERAGMDTATVEKVVAATAAKWGEETV